MIVLDTPVAVAWLRKEDGRHLEARTWAEQTDETFVTTPLVIAEMDHILTRSGGAVGAAGLRHDLEARSYDVEWWRDGLVRTLAVAEQYASLSLGLVDASLVALAAHLGTVRIATFDERHFRVVKPLTGESAFTLLPTDS